MASAASVESLPLLPKHKQAELAKKENIYTYMVHVPPMSVHKHGHYCTCSVYVACALLSLTVVLQISLTIIAGSYLLSQNSLFLDSLVEYQDGDHPQLLHKGIRDLMDPVAWWREAHPRGPATSMACCSGASCAAMDVRCCDPFQAFQHLLFLDVEDNTSSPATEASDKPKAKRRKKAGKSGPPVIERKLCQMAHGSLDCTAPAQYFSDRWHELDIDGDGIWTLKEAQADATNLGCRTGIAAEEVFRNAIHGIRKNVRHDRLAYGNLTKHDLMQMRRAETEKHAILKPQFEWWRGVVAICSMTSPEGCWTLVTRGVFDGAMRPETHGAHVHRGISDLSTAVDYCEWMLRPGGLCDSALPVSHATYRSNRESKCGAPLLSEGPRYTNPHDPGDVAFALEVSYKNLATFELVHSGAFQFFLGLVLVIWYINLVDETKDILNLADFVHNFPLRSLRDTVRHTVGDAVSHTRAVTHGFLQESSAESVEISQKDVEAPPDKEEVEEACLTQDDRGFVIHSIHHTHQIVCVVLVILRIWVIIYMWNVGTAFVLSTHSFADLLLNSLALAFIMDMPEFVFKFLVSDSMKKEMDSVVPMSFPSSLPASKFGRMFFHKTFWGLVLVPLLALFVVRHNDHYNTMPVLEALRCTCSQSGTSCLMASKFSKFWWDRHWAQMAKFSSAAAQPTAPNADVSAAVGAMLVQLGSQMGAVMYGEL